MKAVKLLLSLLLAVSSLLAFDLTRSEAAAKTFKDISSTHRAYKEISYLSEGEIVSGDSKGYFQPSRTVTRAEAAAMIGRSLNLDGTKRQTSFNDVSSNIFASGYIQSAYEKKIISGYKDGSFKPYDQVTRGEMAVMLSKAFNYSYGGTLSGAANALKSRGIAQGMTDGTFGADKSIIRADFAIFLARAIDYTLRVGNPGITFSGEMYVNVDSLNIRTGPSTKYGVKGSVKYKEKVAIGYKVGTWTVVKSAAGTIGFVLDSYLSKTVSSGDDHSQSPLASKTIVIDPGHGGTDAGAIGYGLKEKDVVLDTGKRVRDLLAKTPLNVKMTRDTDTFVTLAGRVSFAKSVNADSFVSIHANAGGGTGSETYYYGLARANPYTTESKLLAEKIQKRLVDAMSTKDRGEKHGDLHVLRENTMPAVLVELAFIDTKADNDKLASPSYRQAAAKAIALGVLDYYGARGYDVSNLYSLIK
ncbi:N-acetylmuramoyl-L-alanine amidase [Bacillus testis]|uniref:N-acetylmuramoyl-L-alanine amidase n=1 Tax=Bacillus testis TaxID=1622072 RepID=UPI00067F0AF5|nr:N-acetylmuramoyl-L-alanine amidase [Bacillus testis]